MDSAQISAALAGFDDGTMYFHAFTDYLRDYEVVAAEFGAPQGVVSRLIFENCVHARADAALPPGAWADSLDSRLTGREQPDDVDGYFWGCRLQELALLELIQPSVDAEQWSARMGFPVHEARISTNGHDLQLIFSDLRIEPAVVGYRPFQVEPDA